MHLIRCNIRIVFAVLLILNFALCEDHGIPKATILPQNEIKNNDKLDPANSESFTQEAVEKRELNVSVLPVSEVSQVVTPTSLKMDPSIVRDKVDPIEPSINSSAEKPKSVKKQLISLELNATKPESNVATRANVPTNVQNDTIKITNIVPADIPKVTNSSDIHNVTVISDGGNVTTTPVDEKDLPKSGAKKRGFIVFGTLGLFSMSYMACKIYKKKKQNRENESSFYTNDNQQFKYGVLLSNENDDNLELSNLPLSIDSEDEEMEIFDIEQKKFLDNNKREAYGLKDHFLAKDDIEILDLDLPGTSSSERANDDNLLNLDDANLHDVIVIQHSATNSGAKPKLPHANEFFDVL